MTELALAIQAPPRTFGRLRLKGQDWLLEDVEPHVAIRLKQIFPRIPKTATAPFKLTRSMATDSDIQWFTQRYPLAMGEIEAVALSAGQAGYIKLQAAMEAVLLPTYEPPALVGMRPGKALRHYQTQPVELCYQRNGLLVGDDCGLGKTIIGCGFCLKPGVCPVAVVCLGYIQPQWVERLREFTTLRVHEVRTAKVYDLPSADVYVFRYTQLAGWVDVFGTGIFKTVIYDEPQELRTGPSTQKGRAANVLSNRATWRMGLTATPIYGYGSEIYNVMRFIDRDSLGAWDDFCREWVSADTKRLKDPKALGTFLREQHVFLRRTKADVGKELAPVNRIVDYVDYDEEAVASIEDLARKLAIRAVTGSFVERGSAARELDLRVRQATGVSKARSVAAYVRMLVEGGKPVLLVGWHREVYSIWLKALADLRPAMYTGSESISQKQAAKQAFLSGQTDILIMSLRGGAGLDGLQARCSTVVFGELDWSPGIQHQIVERVDRDGQTEPVMVLFLVVDDGSDPPMMEVLGIKASDAQQVNDPTLQAAPANSDDRPLRALLRRYLDKDVMANADSAGQLDLGVEQAVAGADAAAQGDLLSNV